MTASPTCEATSKLKALGGCSSHHLQGAGAYVYCGGPARGRTAYYAPALSPRTAAAIRAAVESAPRECGRHFDDDDKGEALDIAEAGIFAGWTPFLSPRQQCRRTPVTTDKEGKLTARRISLV